MTSIPLTSRSRPFLLAKHGICPCYIPMAKSDGHKLIAAGELKQGCLAILGEVAESHAEYVITKRGKPVARLVPLESDEAKEAEVLAVLRSSVDVLVSEEELLAPTDSDAGWNLQD